MTAYWLPFPIGGMHERMKSTFGIEIGGGS